MDNILDTLASAFGPSEAEAASRSPAPVSDPFAGFMRQLQMTQAMARLQDLNQRIQQQQTIAPIRQQLAQQQLATATAKAQPGPQPSDILGGSPSATPSGARAPDVIFRGTTPGTGTPFFTNRPEAVGSMFGPEAQKTYEAQVAKAQPPTPPPGATSDQASIDRAQKAAQLKKAGVPEPEIARALDVLYPSTKKPTTEDIAETKPLGANASKYINLETGEYAKPGHTLRDMTQDPWASIDSARGRIYENLNSTKNHIVLMEKYLNTVPKGGWTWSNYAEMKARMLAGDPQANALGAQLEALTPLAIGRALSNAGARIGPQGAKYMAPAAFSLGDNRETLQEKLDNLKYLVYSTAKENGLPTKPFGDWAPPDEAQTPTKAGTPAATSKGAKINVPSGRVPVINPQGKAVSLPANQVKAALAAGYKPYQQIGTEGY